MWPFTKKPKPINPGPINEDWRVGDLAECLKANGWRNRRGSCDGPEKGDTLKVLAVSCGRDWECEDLWWLKLNGLRGKWDATAFRKVPPLNSEASAEFTAMIKRKKPVRA